MNKFQFTLILLVFLTGFIQAEDTVLKTVRYQGIRATDPAGRLGLRNPERGLSLRMSHWGND